ncbi:MAG: type II secretion system F family protein, partial [Planctomycetales bacterium]|nr:type II secretion system F family protein [Planctomycetales bacterium]
TGSLRDRAAREVAARLADLHHSHLPLPEGLRAAAAEAKRRDVRTALSQIADDLEHGRTLAEAVERIGHRSTLLHGAFLVAAHSPNFHEALFDVLDHQNASWRVRQHLLALAYPVTVCLFSILLFCGIQLTVVKGFHEVFEQFGLRLPQFATISLWWARIGAWMLLALLLFVGVTIAIGSFFVAREPWHRLLGATPLVGVIWRYSGHGELVRVLALLIRRSLPLPTAIELASQCSRNRDAAAVWKDVSARITAGESLAQAIWKQHRVPADVLPFMTWGETTQSLPDSLEVAGDLLQQQADDRALQLRLMLPPLLFAMAAVTIGATLITMLSTMFALLSGLA